MRLEENGEGVIPGLARQEEEDKMNKGGDERRRLTCMRAGKRRAGGVEMGGKK